MMLLPLHLRGTISGLRPDLYKILKLEEALLQHFNPAKVLIDLRSGPAADLVSIASFGFAGVLDSFPRTCPSLHSLTNNAAVAGGDVVRIQRDGKINLLYRRGANANTLFVTERCNSRCVMCSQPPRADIDDWRIPELISLLPLIDRDLAVLGLTGGEPTLLGDGFIRLVEAAKGLLPATRLHVLTNGRTFADRRFVEAFDCVRGHVNWGIPLYGDVAHLHDHVVQAKGAFAETVHGLYNLAERRHRIEIRTVLHAHTLPRMEHLARFLYRNAPFAEHIALMGLEPMGFARSNMPLLHVDPDEVGRRIVGAVEFLHQVGMHVSIYNIPLCALPPVIRPFARKSISDWKNQYAESCDACVVKESCCGFFKSTTSEEREATARPLVEVAA
ncbi:MULTISPECIES: His-Xaa-Ser system radical SAM maturase HxsC [unclassified Bradyrhizobium]|uniref:His-Xaa-Ser system radical SAM maturase HxsC n=1 Tax=unclassified Bradyrhizobium TaxID=2631580 RepID=UPI0028EB7474|nr:MULTISPECIES: His-Xaa-Ser system radical SAM maturase HxsC [unclassified Bradyrhizobium]